MLTLEAFCSLKGQNILNAKMKKATRVGVVVFLGGMILGLGGCNMIGGIGKDIQEMSVRTKAFIEGDKKPKPAAQKQPVKKRGLFG